MTIPPWQFSKGRTPEPIKRLLQVIGILSLSSVFIDAIFSVNTQSLLAVSPDGYLWQFFTSLFFISAPSFSFGYLIDLAFCLLLIWLFGSILYDRIGKTRFFIAYAFGGLVGGITALALMHITHSFYYASLSLYAILALATLWAMTDPYQQLILFFVIPIKAKWLLVVGLVGTILGNLADHNFPQAAAYLATFLASWLFGLLALGLTSPFDWMTHIDRIFKKQWYKLESFWQWKVLGFFRTRDEQFMDKTLDKISKKGRASLSFYETLRLKWISFKKKW